MWERFGKLELSAAESLTKDLSEVEVKSGEGGEVVELYHFNKKGFILSGNPMHTKPYQKSFGVSNLSPFEFESTVKNETFPLCKISCISFLGK